MAYYNTITVTKELRPCVVKGKRALFHEWSHIVQIREALLKGSISGVVEDTFGIVEYETGVVERVLPCDICFCDNKFYECAFKE